MVIYLDILGVRVLRMGTSGLVAQAHGAGDGTETGAHLIRALVIAAVAGLSLILLHPLLFGAACLGQRRGRDAGPALSHDLGRARDIALYAITGGSSRRAHATCCAVPFQNGLNIVLDLGFVLASGMASAGLRRPR